MTLMPYCIEIAMHNCVFFSLFSITAKFVCQGLTMPKSSDSSSDSDGGGGSSSGVTDDECRNLPPAEKSLHKRWNKHKSQVLCSILNLY